MEKITILNENYLDLIQIIAETTDFIEKEKSHNKEEIEKFTKGLMVEGTYENFRASVDFLNAKNHPFLHTITRSINEGLNNHMINLQSRRLKKETTFSLKESAGLSKLFEEITGFEPQDEFEEVTSIFGVDNTEIEKDKDGEFNVTVSGTGMQEAIKNVAKVLTLSIQENTNIRNANSPEEYEKSLYNLVNINVFEDFLKRIA